ADRGSERSAESGAEIGVEPDVVVEPLEQPPATTPATQPIRRTFRRATARQWAVSIVIMLLVILAGVPAKREIMARVAGRDPVDTLFLLERDATGQNQVEAIANPARSRHPTLIRVAAATLGPSWADSLSAP